MTRSLEETHPGQEHLPAVAHRHVHYTESPDENGDARIPKDTPPPKQEWANKRGNTYHEGDFAPDDRSRPSSTHARRNRQQRSMTLPVEFLGGGTPPKPLEQGLGFGFRRPSLRMATAVANSPTSSPSSDDEDLFITGPSLSFRKERLQASPLAGPSRYPGMLQIPDSAISPRTVHKRRIVSNGSSPDVDQRNGHAFTPGTAPTPRATVPSPLNTTPPVAATPRLQAIADDALAHSFQDRPRSRSIHSLSGKQDRGSRGRRVSTDGYVGDVVARRKASLNLHDAMPSGGSGDSVATPTSTRPPSRLRKDSLPVQPVNSSKSKDRQVSEDGYSSTHGPSEDDSINEEKAEVTKTVNRKRKQSEDYADRLRHRSMSTPQMNAVPEFGGHMDSELFKAERIQRPSRRNRMEDLGFEGAMESSQKTQSRAESSAVLDNLLQSVDLANAMRFIQKQTVIPSGAVDDTGIQPVSPTVRISPTTRKSRNGKVAEIFVPQAPPPILHNPDQPGHDVSVQKAEHRSAGGHVAFTHPEVEIPSSDDTLSMRSGINPPLTQGRTSRLPTSSSIPSGLFGSKRHVSNPTSGGKNVESGNTRTQLFVGDTPEQEPKQKRSISERFNLNRHLMSHSKKPKVVERSPQPEADDEFAMEARDMARFQERIQSALLELSHHPRAEKLAYQARSYLQGYYSNVYASVRDRELDPDPIYQFDPLAVIRWRKAVRREEAKRKSYETSRSSTKGFSPGSGTTFFEPRVRTPSKSLNSPDMPSTGNNQPLSKPLHSAELLNRVDQSDTAKHLKVSPALREWVVTPSEIVAYLNCKGVVDHFVPSNEFEHPIWGEMPQIDRSPSTMTASSTRSRSVTSPSSRMWQIKAASNLNHHGPPSAHGSEGAGEVDRATSHGRNNSLDASDRFAAVIKSPLRSIRRHIHPHLHPHLDRDNSAHSAVASDTENEGIRGSRRHPLLNTTQKMKLGQSSKEQVHHVETAPTTSHESIPIPENSANDVSLQKIEVHVDPPTDLIPQSEPALSTEVSVVQKDEFDMVPVELDEEDYGKKLRALYSVENAMNRSPAVERESQALLGDFISTVEAFRKRRGCLVVDDDLRKVRRLQLGYIGQMRTPAVNGEASGKPAELEQDSHGKDRVDSTQQISAFDPLYSVKHIIEDLHDRYNLAIRQAIEVCQQQDAVQHKVSELLPEAETLLAKIGDQVRKLRAIRESFYTLDAIRSNSNPAYYCVVNAGFWVASWIVWAALLCVRYLTAAFRLLKRISRCLVRPVTAFGMLFIHLGISIGECVRSVLIGLGSALTNLAFWVALFTGIVIGAIFFNN